MDDFYAGPFRYSEFRGQRWTLSYDNEFLAERRLEGELTRSRVREAFAGDVAKFVSEKREAYQPDVFKLLDVASDAVLATISLRVFPEGVTPGLPNDSSPLWLVTHSKPTRSRPITLTQFAALGALKPPPLAWVAELFPAELLTLDVGEWQAPNSWQWRNIVGVASFTGITGDQAAALVGLTPQYLRKCMASEDASSRSVISFAHWHLLLQRLGVMPAVPVLDAC